MTDSKKTNILLVQRDPYSLYILKEALKEEGYGVTAVGNGEEALRFLMRRTPDLISIDLNLPNKTGIMFYHSISRNKKWSRIPLVTISGSANGAGKDKGDWDVFAGRKVFGPSIYLEKPVRLEDFLELIHRAMGKPPTTRLLPTEIEAIREKAIEAIKSADDEKIVQLEAALSKNRKSSKNIIKKVAAII